MPTMLQFTAGHKDYRRRIALRVLILFSALGALSAQTPVGAQMEVVQLGGEGGLSWASGGGEIPALVILDAATVDQSNAPGGVIDFAPFERERWIFPQQADTTDNILIGVNSKERGGSVITPIPSFRFLEADFPQMFDDDGNTALVLKSSGTGGTGAFGLLIEFDLGAIFGVNRFKFFPRNADPAFPAPDFQSQDDFLKGYEIFVNDGQPESRREGSLIWETVAFEGQNQEAVVDVRIPTRFVRFLRLKSLTAADFEIAEFQVFSEGFVPQAVYISNVFDFGDQALLGRLRWVAEQVGDPTRSRVQVRTRSGDDPQPVEFTRIGKQSSGRVEQRGDTVFDIPIDAPWKRAEDVEDSELENLVANVLDNEEMDGREALLTFGQLPFEQRAQITLGQADYNKLASDQKSVIREDLANWSPWSPPYSPEGIVAPDQLQVQGAGTLIVSPSPRRYFQVMIEFFNADVDAATGIGGVAWDVFQPVFADSLIAEILPRTAILGQATRFTYGVLVKSSPQNAGFDRFEISTPLRTESIGQVEIRRPDGTAATADFSGLSLATLPVEQNGFSVVAVRDDALVMAFPRIEEDGALLTLEFENTVLRLGTRFAGRALNADNEALGQVVLAGNAADLSREGMDDPDRRAVGALDPENLFVNVPITDELLVNVAAVPSVFTPNGDGVNERAAITYDITNIAHPTRVRLGIYDLSGRLIRNLYEGLDMSGRFPRFWDGRDDENNAVPPGHYIFSVALDAGTGEEQQVGVVGVAY